MPVRIRPRADRFGGKDGGISVCVYPVVQLKGRRHSSKARWMLESFVYPRHGSSAGQCDHCRGTHETAHQTKQRCSQIFRDALATGRAVRDITVDLRGALAPVVSESHAAITNPAKIGALLRAIDVYDRHPTTAIALKLAPLVFVRPGELRGAEWSELDLDAAEWRIPAERMNMGERHIVPLASQAVELLRVQREAHGGRQIRFSLAAQPSSTNINEHCERRAVAMR